MFQEEEIEAVENISINKLFSGYYETENKSRIIELFILILPNI